MTTLAEVKLWGRTIGAVALEDGRDIASFQYEPSFAATRYEVSPLKMPLARRIYEFPELARESFHGLPGMLADSLPDRFGNALIDAWLATRGRAPQSFNAVERLCYVGARGMGALEFEPAIGPKASTSEDLEVAALVELAAEVLAQRQVYRAELGDGTTGDALADILRVGTSAGGARAKAIIAWNRSTNEVRSGQVKAGQGFEYWLLKFDGVAGNRDKELEDPQGYGAIEYAYHLMAVAAGCEMSECRLLEENGRRHFMSKRFDRLDNGEKLHMQSLGALAHYDYNRAGSNSYEQAMSAARALDLSTGEIEQMFRRMVLNVAARNQDDHVKNIAFLMNKQGRWSLAPAFDVTYSYNPAGRWTATHQMTMNGKREGFGLDDFKSCARTVSLQRGKAEAIVEEVCSSVKAWREFAERARVPTGQAEQIESTLITRFE